MTIRTWKTGFASLYKGANAEQVASEIESLGNDVTPTEILEKAKDDTTELHKCFEWEDSVAAEKWRLQQARMIVCHLVIKEDGEDAADKPEIRIFHKTDRADGYKSITFIMRDKTEYEKLLAQARKELRVFKQKYHNLSELEEILALID